MFNNCYTYRCAVVTVIDGSTFIVELDLGMDIYVRKKVKLIGIRCHNIHVPKGLQTREFVEGFLKGKDVLAQTFRDKYRKYTTILAVLFVSDGPDKYINFNDLLVEKLMAEVIKNGESENAD